MMHVGIAKPRWRGKTLPAFPAHAQLAILHIWQEAHWCYFLTGYYLRFPGASEVKISTKWATDFDYYSADGGEWVPDKWLHLIFTWKAGEGIRAYLNGCDMDPDGSKDYAYSRSRSEDATHTFPFLVGSGIEDWEDRDGTTIDELYIWYEKLSPIQIWQFYIQGGTIQ